MSHNQPHEKSELESLDPLPLEVEQITPEWFASILKLPVTGMKIIKTIHGTASKILCELSYSEELPADVAPRHVCVKGGFVAELRLLGLVSAYHREAEFYYHLAPLLNIRLPKCWYAGTTKDQGLVVLEDLIAANNTFGSTIEAWPVERVSAGLEQLAILHGTTSGPNPLEKYPWAVPHISAIVLNMVSEVEWNKRFAPEAAPPVPESQINRRRIEAAFKTLWKQTPILTTFIHGDCHSGNTYLNSKGEPGFIDWQGPHVGSALHDVAYFLVGALTIEDRRANERALLSHYLETLHAAGGPKLLVEDVWTEYQYQNLHGFVWPLSGPLMQPKEIVDEMSRRHGAAIEDHRSLEILEGLPSYVGLE